LFGIGDEIREIGAILPENRDDPMFLLAPPREMR